MSDFILCPRHLMEYEAGGAPELCPWCEADALESALSEILGCYRDRETAEKRVAREALRRREARQRGAEGEGDDRG